MLALDIELVGMILAFVGKILEFDTRAIAVVRWEIVLDFGVGFVSKILGLFGKILQLFGKILELVIEIVALMQFL